MKNAIIGLLAAIFVVTAAALSAPPDPTLQPCVAVSFTLHSYDGPIVIEDACLSSFAHTGDLIDIDTVDFGSNIFRSGFEP